MSEIGACLALSDPVSQVAPQSASGQHRVAGQDESVGDLGLDWKTNDHLINIKNIMVRAARNVRTSTVRACIFMYKMALQGNRVVNWFREIRTSGSKETSTEGVGTRGRETGCICQSSETWDACLVVTEMMSKPRMMQGYKRRK